MSRVAWVVPVLAVSLIGWSSPRALAQETKTARGTVTATSGDSITIKVRNQEMKFTVDDKTEVIATGAGHQAAAAKAAGKKVTVQDVVKTGESVEVKYHDMGGTMHAASVRQIATAGAGSLSTDAPMTKRANGTVKSVAADSLTVTSAGKDMTFAVDKDTHVVAVGAGTKAKETGGRLPAITEAVKEGDVVSVSYHDMAGTLHAAEVRVTRKAPK
jgi:uncharacterized protein DUF5666